MSIEEENARPAPGPSDPGMPHSPSAERGPRRPRRPREDGPRDRPAAAGAGEGGGSGDYKPSEAAGRREPGERSSERPSARGGRPRSGERERGGERSGGGERRGRSGGDDRRGGRPERAPRARGDDRPTPKKEASAATDNETAAATPEPNGFLDELGGTLLESVSRSFSLTIKVLPAGVREPITAGYLLARALDTVADTAAVAPAKRLEHLRALLEMIKYGPDPELLRPLQKDVGARQSHEGEKELIQKLDRCLAWLDALPPEDQWDLRRTLFRIGRGQELDVMRFGEGTAAEPKALATEQELDEYTYFVAGCVGELWTRLCARHLPEDWSRLGTDEMLKLGKHFGQGLQMVNILRDLPADLENGRCYLPESLLTQNGLTPATVAGEPARARPIVAALRKQAVAKLDDAWKYARAITAGKLRYACALPVLIGVETLGLIAKTSPLESSERIKVTKTGVRGLMVSSVVGTALGAWHDRQYRRSRERAMAEG